MLLKCIDIFSRWILRNLYCTVIVSFDWCRCISKERGTYKAIIINGVDVLLLGDHVTKATTSGVFKGNARCLGTQDSINVVPVVELVVETFGNVDGS